MPASKAQIRATNKYIGKAYERINLVIPRGRKEEVEAHAKRKGESVVGLINRLLRAELGMSESEWKQRGPDHPGEE